MKILPIIIVFTFVTATQIHGKPVLNRMSRADLDNEIQLYVYFNELPDFKQRLSNKRLDVTLTGSVISTDFSELVPDEAIVKTLVTQNEQDIILSFFFRYIPQDVKISTGQADSLVIDILPGNRFTRTYQRLAHDLGSVFVINRSRPYPVNPLYQSSYRNNWADFFTSYKSSMSISPPLSVLIPPFPWTDLIENIEADMNNYPSKLINTLDQKDLLNSLTFIQNALRSNSGESSKKYLALLHAEILFRLGNIDAASSQLKLIGDAYQNESISIVSRYLNFLIDAQKGDYHLAHAGIKRISQIINSDNLLIPFLHISLIETGLVLKQTDYVSELIKSLPQRNGIIEQRLQIRIADFYQSRKDYSLALQHYAEIAKGSDLYQLPYALNGYCTTLQKTRLYNQSSDCFRSLQSILLNDEQKGMALYLSAMTDAEQPPAISIGSQLDQLIKKYPGTEAALRAEQTIIDLCVSGNSPCIEKALHVYDRLAQVVQHREISSEALFKKALLQHIIGDNTACIVDLAMLLRNYQASAILEHAQALMIQLLPNEIYHMLDQGDDAGALILARQNQRLFDNRWIDFSVLYKLTPALERLGLYRESIALLLFLLNEYDPAEEQQIYLSLARLANLQGDVQLVQEFSNRYFHDYPNGLFQEDILFYLIDATYSAGWLDRAIAMLPIPLPDRTDFKLIASLIFFQQDLFEKSTEILKKMHKGLLPDNHIFILSEGLFELGQIDEALIYYSILEDVPDYSDLARYRIAQIERDGAMPAVTANQLQKIAGASLDSQWQRFASQNLRYMQLMELL